MSAIYKQRGLVFDLHHAQWSTKLYCRLNRWALSIGFTVLGPDYYDPAVRYTQCFVLEIGCLCWTIMRVVR